MASRKRKKGRGGAPPFERSRQSAAAGGEKGGGKWPVVIDHLDIIIAGLIALLFVAHLFADGGYFLGSGSDIISLEHPMHLFATSWMARGVLPLWNPFICNGVPFQAGVHGYLYPGWWTGLLLPTGLDIKVGIAIHLVIAATGAAWFARGRVTHRAASCLAGVTFALSAFFVSHLFAGHRVIAATACYLPWLAGALDRGRKERRHFIFAVSMSGLMMLAGHYQVIFIGMGGLLLWALLDRILNTGLPDLLRSTRASLVYWTALLAGGALVAAVQILPMLSTVTLSQRTGGDASFAASFSSAPINLLTFLLPNLFGNRIDAPFVGDWSYWESLGYLGIVPLALVLLAPVVLPWRRALPALIVSALALGVGLGDHTPLFDLYLRVVPGADLFRSPGRFCLLSTLFGSLIAAEVLDTWLRGAVTARRRVMAVVLLFSVALVIPTTALTALSLDISGLHPWLMHFVDSAHLASIREADWQALGALAGVDIAKASLLFIGTAGLLTWGVVSGPSRAGLIGFALVAVQVLDLYHFGHRFMKTGDEALFHLPDTVVAIIRDETEPGIRIIPPAERQASNFPAMYDMGNPGGYDIFWDNRYARYINRSQHHALDSFVAIERVRLGSPLIRLLGPRFLLTTMPLVSGRNRFISGYDWMKPDKRVGDIYIYKNPDPPSRVVLSHRVAVIADEESTYRLMEQTGFDLQEAVLLEAPLPQGFTAPKPRKAGTDERAAITTLNPNRVEISVEASSDAILLMSDALYPGWTATVDGKEVPMVHANRIMRALPVSVGKHTVVMTYMPTAFVAGLFLSIAAIVLLMGLGIIGRFRLGRVSSRVAPLSDKHG